VGGPGVALRVGQLRLDGDQRGIAFSGKNDGVISLHAPVVGEIDNVVRRADDEGAQILIFHDRMSSASSRRLANASRTVFRRDASRTASWASFAKPRTLAYSFASRASRACARIGSARLTSAPFRFSRPASRSDSRRATSAAAWARAS